LDNKLTDDTTLASGIRKDNLKAFELLYDRYKEKIYFFSIRYLADKSDAEEIVQMVFISLWEHRQTLDVSKSIKSYIYKITVNHIYNYLKKKAIQRRYIETELLKSEGSSNSTLDNIFYIELEKKIILIISSLSAQQQLIFRLSRFEGLSHEEIAKKLELSIRTVENQIYRVLKVIKMHLKEELFLLIFFFL
jgi:RNA polymerase sigma-70 factor (ECF subfamily)